LSRDSGDITTRQPSRLAPCIEGIDHRSSACRGDGGSERGGAGEQTPAVDIDRRFIERTADDDRMYGVQAPDL